MLVAKWIFKREHEKNTVRLINIENKCLNTFKRHENSRIKSSGKVVERWRCKMKEW
jgi:hypothetical protein